MCTLLYDDFNCILCLRALPSVRKEKAHASRDLNELRLRDRILKLAAQQSSCRLLSAYCPEATQLRSACAPAREQEGDSLRRPSRQGFYPKLGEKTWLISLGFSGPNAVNTMKKYKLVHKQVRARRAGDWRKQPTGHYYYEVMEFVPEGFWTRTGPHRQTLVHWRMVFTTENRAKALADLERRRGQARKQATL
jgi:hypothetical protein